MKSVFIIPSCVNFDSSIALDYSPVRSVYSPKERFEQTLETISSIRRLSHTSDILLCEMSELSEVDQEILSSKTDYFIYRNKDNHSTFDFFKDHPNKSHGESFAILKSLLYLKNMQFPLYDVYFKISGRYKLNNNFNIHNHTSCLFNAKQHDHFEGGVFTTLFSFNKSFFNTFADSMLLTHSFTTNNYPPFTGFSLETNLLWQSMDKINYLDTLGVEGNFGPDGEKHLQ